MNNSNFKTYFQKIKQSGSLILLSLLTISCHSQAQHKTTPKTSKTIANHEVRLKYTSGVRTILQDSKGNYWFGSHQEGACVFDGDTVIYFTVEDGLSHNQIRTIFEDSNGLIWFEGAEGQSSYDGKKITTRSEIDFSNNNKWQSGENDLWFKEVKTSRFIRTKGISGVNRYDGSTLAFYAFPLPPVHRPDYFYAEVSTPFAKGKNGRYWFGTYSAVVGFNGVDFTFFNDQYLGFNEDTGYLHVRSIFEDSKGNLWIGNNGIGVLKYDGKTMVNFSESQGLISAFSKRSGGYRSPPFSLEHVFSIEEDRQGNIWFGDRDTGAWKYDGENMSNYTIDENLETQMIWDIYQAKNGELLFGMADGGVYLFDQGTFKRKF